jgi:purine-binding chemotaxis protein CheW
MGSKEIKVLIFSVNGERYAADIMEVERIINYENPTKLPDSPSFVEGVVTYEGSVLPVISLAKKFRLAHGETPQDSKIIVARQDDTKIGIVVDTVSEVKDVNTGNIENPPEVAAGISKRYIKGLIKIDRQIIIFLNLGTVLSDEEKIFLS